MKTILQIPHGTNELLPLNAKVDGIGVTTGVKYSIVSGGGNPVSWTTAEAVAGTVGARINSLAAGDYEVWVQITTGSEISVIDAGGIRLT